MSVFKTFEPDDIVRANPREITQGLWPGGTGSLGLFFTSEQSGSTSGQYYWNVYNLPYPDSASADICFAVAYGHRTGGGHPTLNDDDLSTLATQVVYSQYRQLLLDPGDTKFTFEGPVESDQIYAINVQRYQFKERLDPGNWMLTLSGSNGVRTFIDDSGQALGAAFGKSGQVFNVVSGSLTGAQGSTIAAVTSSTEGGFGLFYPSLGVIILNPAAISSSVGFASGSIVNGTAAPFAPVTDAQTTPQYNHAGLLKSIKLGGDFQARSSENISSTHYFVRLNARDFNYSNNPSYYDETNGTLIHTQFIDDPRTFPTQIGLYNDANELLAIAKFSRPVQKSSQEAINARVRLDW